MSDAFSDSRHIIRSHIPAVNAPARVEIPTKKSIPEELIGDSKPRQKREVAKVSENTPEVVLPPEEVQAPEVAVTKLLDVGLPPEENVAPEVAHAPEVANASTEAKVPENYEISMNYIHNAKLLDRGSIEVDDVYAFSMASDIIMNSDPEPQSMEEFRHRDDWPKWKIAIQEELQSLCKRNVFGPAVQTPAGVFPVGNRWETYSPVMDGVTFRFLMGMACMEKLETRLMDVMTAYLYGSLDSDIYMKISEGLNIEDTKPRHLYSVKLQRSFYGLKQSGRMWYNIFSEYLLNDGYVNNQVCPCIFIKRSSTGFVIIAVYVDDLNIFGTTEDITNVANYLKNEFEMKDLGRTRFCLGIQVEHLSSGIFVHQSNYTEKILDRFHMDKAHPLTTPMVVRSLEAELIDPAVKGTLNVIRSCAKAPSAKRVSNAKKERSVPLLSSMSMPWYVLSKTLTEDAAWKFVKERGIDMVTVNPAMVIEPLLQPSLNTSAAALLNLIKGVHTYPNASLGWVNVKDVANAHIQAFEITSAKGRYCMVESVVHYSELVDKLRDLYPSLQLPVLRCANDKPFVATYQVSKEKIKSLGINYIPFGESLKETAESLKERKLFALSSAL
ncbi:hypothetical protein AgCh_001527 [Apium graveolens]